MKKATKPADTAAAPALIVFGVDDSQRPHASWFNEADALLAEKAAGLMGLKVRVTTPEHRAVADERVFASGKVSCLSSRREGARRLANFAAEGYRSH